MESTKIPTTARRAFEWLRKMNIEVKLSIDSGDMYEFKYKEVLMFITTDTNDKELFISAPVYLMGKTDAENRDIFETAKYMTNDDLKDYIVEYVRGQLSYIGQTYVRPKHIPTLRKYQFLQMLDEIVDVYYTFLTATMIVAAPLEYWMGDYDSKQ